MLLSIDPAVTHFAYAHFERAPAGNSQVLIACGLVRFNDFEELTLLADIVKRTAVGGMSMNQTGDAVVIEKPQVYAQRNWKGDPNDLIDVALTAGIVAGVFDCRFNEFVRPHEWKGNAPKEVIEKRVVTVLEVNELKALAAAQDLPKRKLVTARMMHNVVDAVGIGLWKLNRLQKG